MILIFFPVLVYVCSLVASFVSAIFLRRYLWKLCVNKVVAFTIGAIVFLIASKLFSIIASLILSAISRSLGEAGQLLGILAFSYGDKLIYFVTITPALLACVVGYKYLSAKILYLGQIPEAEVATNKPRLFLGLSTGISVLVFLWALFGSWGPLYGIVTVPVASNFPRLLATSLHQPRLCLLMPAESFNTEYDYRAIGMQCLHDSQTQEEYYNHCDLIPTSVRESKFSSLAVSPSMSPFQECVTHRAESLANDSTSSLSQDAKANTCNEIRNLARRATCLLPYVNTSAWTTMCSTAINNLKQAEDNYNAQDAVIIGRCLDKQTVNELDANGAPLWFNYHVITGYDKYGIPVKAPEIIYWLSSMGVNPNSTNSKGQNFLSYLLDSAFGSEHGQAVENSYATDFIKIGIDVHSKDKSGLSTMDYAFSGGYSRLVYSLLPLFKDYRPSADVVTSFLTICHDSKERGTAQDECYGLFDGEHYENARQEFLKLGLLQKETGQQTPSEPLPYIISITPSYGRIGTTVEIKGNNLSGFEGDLDVYFERSDGKKFMLTDTFGDYLKTGGSLIKVVVKEPCQQGERIYGRYSGDPSQCNFVALTPDKYKVYVEPWGKKSNITYFTVTP